MKTLFRLGCLAVCVAGFLFISMFAALVAPRGPVRQVAVAPPPAPDPDKTFRVAARMLAKEEIMRWVKHPLDASLGTLTAEFKMGGWAVEGTVKAKNDFGGTLTHRYAIVYDVIDDKLSLRTVVIDGDVKWLADRTKEPPTPEPEAQNDGTRQAQ